MNNDKRQEPKAETAGFTLVEIVAVLVLLGILAAVAVPKFFDLSSDAEKKAAEAALMEAQVRINAGYSKAVYAGKSCEDAVEVVSSLAKIGDGGKNVINGYTLTLQDGDQLKEAPGSYVTLTKSGKSFDSSTFENLKQIFKPTCAADSSDTPANGGLVCPGGSSGGGETPDTPTCSKAICDITLTCVDGTVKCSCSCTEGGKCECPTAQISCSGGSSGGSDFVNPFVWDGNASCEKSTGVCKRGMVFIENGKYYYARTDLSGISGEISDNPGISITETKEYKSGNIVEVFWPAVVYNKDKNSWNPVQVSAGNVYHAEDGNWYGVVSLNAKHKPNLPPSHNMWVKLIGY